MGCWDELCLLCGMAPSGGPEYLHYPSDVPELAHKILADFQVISDSEEELLSIVTEALNSSFSKNDPMLNTRPSWLPQGICSESSRTHVAIGYFDEDGEAHIRQSGRVPDGRHVEKRRVRGGDSGEFDVQLVMGTTFVTDVEDSDNQEYVEVEAEVEEPRLTMCSVRNYNANLWLCEKCYQCLEAWLNIDNLPSRSSVLVSGSDSMSLAGELYEIVNSQAEHRQDLGTGLLACINYDGIELTLEQWQDFFAPARRGSRHLEAAIFGAGLRGRDLIPALMKDFRCWMFMRLDLWPEPTDNYPKFLFFDSDRHNTAAIISSLPEELLILILRDVPVSSLLSLAASCRSLRSFITEPRFMNCVLYEAILHGSLHWILPVPGETLHAKNVESKWLSKFGLPAANRSALAFASLQFPYLPFVFACLESDSMKNRNRIWGQVQQFEQLWRDYRMNGWKVDRFFPSCEQESST